MKEIGQLATSHATYTAKRGQTVREVVKYMSKAGVGAMPIIDRGRLAGIFTERDLMTKIDEVMTTDIVIADAGETYEASLRTMRRVGCRHLPVVKEGRLVGMVSLRDLLQLDLEEKEETVRLMTSYVYYLPPGTGNA
jgi:CBS domain-containing protein